MTMKLKQNRPEKHYEKRLLKRNKNEILPLKAIRILILMMNHVKEKTESKKKSKGRLRNVNQAAMPHTVKLFRAKNLRSLNYHQENRQSP